MAPQVLHCVIFGQVNPEPWQKELISIRPAILHGHRRHRVKGEDYPGILPAYPTSAVLGSVVTGLSEADIYRLDKFEGSEYEKRKVNVQLLGLPITITTSPSGCARSSYSSKLDDRGSSEAISAVLETTAHEDLTDHHRTQVTNDEIEVYTYIWTAGDDKLEDAEWDFESFKREKMQWWVNADERNW